ncbi:MAG: RluA family pseudouridine synthase [Alphaproteobacteria bacterium]|nr:RluA family pseudouridine synthase [Alphaproteobacteria bacterium]
MTQPPLQDMIIYRDALMLVLNKPSGVPVHAGPGKLIPLDVHFEDLRFGLPQKPELAHRLDKDTSGCLILGRHAQALKRLGLLFKNNAIEKTYHALVHITPESQLEQDGGVIDLPLGPKSERTSSWWMKVDHERGKPSVTHYRVLGRFDEYAYLELKPQTGRTHQLRVHCQAMGCPILGDPIYGLSDDPTTHLHLHAYSVTIPLYPKKEPLHITAPLPDYIGDWYTKITE